MYVQDTPLCSAYHVRFRDNRASSGGGLLLQSTRHDTKVAILNETQWEANTASIEDEDGDECSASGPLAADTAALNTPRGAGASLLSIGYDLVLQDSSFHLEPVEGPGLG